MPLDPELERRLATVRDEDARRADLAARIRKERRVLLPILGLAVLAFPNFKFGKVQGHSMEPTYHTGDTLVILKTYRSLSPIHVGDIVVVKLKHGATAGEEIVKRVVFMQNHQGTATLPTYLPTGRGQVPSEPWFPQYSPGGMRVPADGILVMGDNTLNSMDSRDFGPVYDYEIEGKVLNP